MKLEDLVETCQLMGSVLEFQQQAMGILTTGKLSDMIIESMKVRRATSYNTFQRSSDVVHGDTSLSIPI